jgi:hypothetical protein
MRGKVTSKLIFIVGILDVSTKSSSATWMVRKSRNSMTNKITMKMVEMMVTGKGKTGNYFSVLSNINEYYTSVLSLAHN